jgi:hypothetical protein
VRYKQPELLVIENDSFPCQELGGFNDNAVRGGEAYIICSLGSRTKPSLPESITQLLGIVVSTEVHQKPMTAKLQPIEMMVVSDEIG